MEHLTGPCPRCRWSIAGIVQGRGSLRRGAGRAGWFDAGRPADAGCRGRRAAGRRRVRAGRGVLGGGRPGDGGARRPDGAAEDFLSALRRDHVPRVARSTGSGAGRARVDTGELTVGGVDVLTVIARCGDRIAHVQFKDALAVDDAEDTSQPHAHWTVRVRGGAREVPRWFAEPGADGGLVDFPAVTRALLDVGYAGWIVVESDQSPHPAASARWPATSCSASSGRSSRRRPPDGHRRHRSHRRQPDRGRRASASR